MVVGALVVAGGRVVGVAGAGRHHEAPWTPNGHTGRVGVVGALVVAGALLTQYSR